ncbi:MAG: lipopolysaccharide export system permease protein lptG [Acidobacteriota bacterium]|nr:lipopolysaccharide export system permease protein lptG [Acidobacteriota bacterium]
MLERRLLLDRYLIKTVTPYLFLSLLILTGLLLLQQSGKFAEVLSFARDPFALTMEIMFGVLPGVLLFTLPMSVLVGTSTGFARLGSDSELVALRAAGMSRRRLTTPVLVFAIFISSFAVLDAFVLAPRAVRSMRQVLYRAALDKLESPIQPRSFNTQLPGKVVYVRDGDESHGEWGRVFIHWSEPGGELRLITARKGRLDVGGDQTELVLSDAVVTTISPQQQVANSPVGQILTERSEQLRLRINSGRASLASQLARDTDEDELGWGDLIDRYRQSSGNAKRDALSSFYKRLALAVTPIPFVLVGVGLGTRARRGGRALGAFYSLFAMVLYYLVFLGGDYLTRTGAASPLIGNWAATAFTLVAGVLLVLPSDVRLSSPLVAARLEKPPVAYLNRSRRDFRSLRLSLLGLLDRTVLTSLVLYFLLSLTVLSSVFLIFTFFETLRLAAARGTPPSLIPLYLLYLIPFASTAVLPIATLLSVLTTYALMARRSEAISWWSTGQSFYRLALPSFIFSLFICTANYGLQERLLPAANRKQNALRSQIRGEPVRAGSSTGFQWLAVADRHIYSYKYGEGSEVLEEPTDYQFDEEGIHLREIARARVGHPTRDGGLLLEEVSTLGGLDKLSKGISGQRSETVVDENTQFSLFKPTLKQPNEYETKDLRNDLRRLSATVPAVSPSYLNALVVTLWKRAVEPCYSLVMWINALPLALSFGRRSVIRPLAFAVILGLCFWLGNAVLSQAGIYGLISPQISVLMLPVMLSLSGVYLLSRTRT